MKIYQVFLLFTFFFLADKIAFAQQSHKAVKFDKIGTEEGLSQSSVQCIAQDFRGFMWFGTQNGLNKFDGYNFTVFKAINGDSTSLMSNFIQQIFEDSKKNLWVAAGGLQVFNHESQSFRRYRHNPNDPLSIPSNYVQCFYEDHFGNLWIGTSNGLARLKADKNGKPYFEVFKNDVNKSSTLSHNNVLTIFQDSERSLWIGTEHGLNRMNPDKRTFSRFEHQEANPNSLAHSTVRSICEDTRGNLWIGTPNGLSCLASPHRNKGYFTNFRQDKYPELSDNNIKICYKDKDGWVWIGTVDGLNRIVLGDEDKPYFIKYQSNPLDRYSLSDNHIISMAEDRDGVIWFGTFLGGFNKFDKNKEKFIAINKMPTALSTISDNNVTSFCEDETGVWVGTGYGGLNKVSIYGDKLTFKSYKQGSNSISNNHITDIKKSKDGYLWIATFGGGVCRMNPQTEEIVQMRARSDNANSLSSDFVRALLVDEDRNLWIGSSKGIDVLQANQEMTHFKNGNNGFKGGDIHHFFEGKNDQIWIASSKGLYSFDKKLRRFMLYTRDFSQNTTLSSNLINFVHEDVNGFIWIGTDAGLNRLEPKKGTFRLFTEKDGLANNSVMGILEDGHYNLWLTTLKGISKFSAQNESFRNYDITDGLQGNEFNPAAVFKGKSGKFYVGGLNGFNIFDPESIKDNQNSPDIVITNFMVNNKSMPLKLFLNKNIPDAKKIYLEGGQNNFSFEFAALQFSEPTKNLYAYRLEGFETDWIFTGAERRFASYTNMPDGEYTFMVRGANSDGVWNDIGTSIVIVIAPPIWKTWWFATFIAASILFGLSFIIQKLQLFKGKDKKTTESLEAAKLEESRLHKELEDKSRFGAVSNLDYASQIQRAILPDEHDLRSLIPDAVHYSKPAFTVSADFFWTGEKYGKVILAVVDCSGMGITGAFMSFVVNAMLNEIVNVKGYTDAHLILRELDKSVRRSFYKGTLQGEEEIEVGVCTINPKNKTLEFAGAKNDLVVMKNGEMIIFKGDRHTINGSTETELFQYNKNTISYEKPLTLYTFTDGFSNQFGGLTGKKFKMGKFKDLLFQIHTLPLNEQRNVLKDTFENWVGEKHEQIDDVLVVAFQLGV